MIGVVSVVALHRDGIGTAPSRGSAPSDITIIGSVFRKVAGCDLYHFADRLDCQICLAAVARMLATALG